MDESTSSDGDRKNSSKEEEPEGRKRLKTEDSPVEESSSSSGSTAKKGGTTASTSTDSGFPKSRSTKHRNYRKSKGDDESTNENGADADNATLPRCIIDSFDLHDSPTSSDSNSTLSLDSDTSDSNHSEECVVLKKEKPKHTWYAIPELINRQIGSKSNLQSRELFQRRCYGSLRSVQRLELMYKLEEHEGCVNSLNFHHDGTLLASGADDLKIIVWDWKVGKILLKYKSKHKGNVFQSKFLHLNGDLHIASCARDGQVRIAQVSREEGVRSNRLLGSHKGPCHKLIVLPEEPHVIISVGEDSVILRHDVRGPKSCKITCVESGEDKVALYSIHGHPLKTHEFCVSGGDDIVRTYDERKADKTLATYCPFKKGKNGWRDFQVTSAVYNYNGSEILATYSDADIYLFDVNGGHGSYIHRYHGHRNRATIKGVNFFGPKSEFVVSGSDCGHIYFWDKNTESIVQWLLADDNGVVNCIEPHPQLPFICSSGLDWDVKMWVPSCETEPTMPELADTVKSNVTSRMSHFESSLLNESQMVWMLWRNLRSASRRTTLLNIINEPIFDHTESSSSSSSSNSNSASNNEDDEDEDDEELDGPPGCTTS